MSESKLGTVNCYSCDSNHQNMELHEYKGQQPDPFTHWFTCPKTGDSVSVIVKTFEGKPKVMSDELAMALVKASQNSTGYIAITVTPIEDGENNKPRVDVYRTSDKFPHSHWMQAINDVVDNLKAEMGPLQDVPMKTAPLPDEDEPFKKLFGAFQGNDAGK